MGTAPALDEIYGIETLWRTTGNYLCNLEHYRKSLKYYDRAVEVCPNDIKTLLDRAKARAKVCQFEQALDDIKEALSIDKRDIISLAAKAHITYLNCEIEEALIQNYRLLPRRTKPNVFFLGILNCVSALEHSLGEICGRPLRDHFLIIRKQAWIKNYMSEKKVEFEPRNKPKKKRKTKHDKLSLLDKLREINNEKLEGMADLRIRDSLHSNLSEDHKIPPLETPFKFHPLQRYTKNVDLYMAEKYLDRMFLDKVFLKSIRKHQGVDCPNPTSATRIREIALDSYCNVCNKQEVLRSKRPFYYLKYVEAKVSGNLKLRQAAELQLHQQNMKKEADKIADKLRHFFNSHNLNGVISYVEKLKLYCDSKSKRILPNKEEYMQLIYEIIRKAFYNVNRINQEQLRWDQDKRIMLAVGQPISRDPSRDSVISFYRNFTMGLDLNDEIIKFKNRLVLAENDDEVCWYYHELGRYNMLLGKYDEALNYANNCIYTARAYDQIEWVVNATVLLIRIHVRLKSKGEALVEAKNVLDMAKQLKDHKLQLYINRCIIVLNELEFDDFDGKKRIEKREAKILNLMNSDKLKEEFAHLFRTMKSMPHHRRISIVPHAGGRKSSEGGKEKSEFSLARKSKLGIEDPKDATEGARLLSLVQFHVD